MVADNSKSKRAQVYTKTVAGGRLQTLLFRATNTKQKKLINGLVLLLVVLVATGGVLWHRQQQQNKAATAAAQAYNQLKNQYQALALKNQYGLAEDTLTKYLDTNPSAKYRAQAEAFMGEDQYNLRKFDSALSWYQKAINDSSKPDYSWYYTVGRIDEQKGDKQGAINNYQKSVELLKQIKTGEAPALASSIQSVINKLKGQIP